MSDFVDTVHVSDKFVVPYRTFGELDEINSSNTTVLKDALCRVKINPLW